MERKVKRQFEPSVRYLNGLTIYFKDKDTVIAIDRFSTIICERWFDRAVGSYARNWQPFCEVLRTRNGLTSTNDIWNYALKYEIGVMSSMHNHVIPEGIKIRESKYKAKRRKK